MTYVYAFDHKHRKAPMSMKDLLGGKGANLAEMMTVLKLPVPHGFTVTTDACRDYMRGGWPKSLDKEIAAHVAALEKKMGRKLGDAKDPLLVSVRSGAKFSMPGMMDTVLNLGLNDASVQGLARSTNDERFAYDSYRRFIAMYGRIVLGVDGHSFEHPLEAAKAAVGTKNDADLPAAKLRELCEQYKAIVKRETGKDFPQEPAKQLRGAVEAVFRSWNGARASPTACARRLATTSARRSTCRRWCSATATASRAPASASRATRRRARTSLTATTSSTRKAKTWWPASATPKTSTR